MAEEVIFKCLRCGHEYKGMYDKKNPEERACPKCGSNSIRPLPTKK
jgi:DNA-directed RNA polymerase subunit RPC12/RpoP